MSVQPRAGPAGGQAVPFTLAPHTDGQTRGRVSNQTRRAARAGQPGDDHHTHRKTTDRDHHAPCGRQHCVVAGQYRCPGQHPLWQGGGCDSPSDGDHPSQRQHGQRQAGCRRAKRPASSLRHQHTGHHQGQAEPGQPGAQPYHQPVQHRELAKGPRVDDDDAPLDIRNEPGEADTLGDQEVLHRSDDRLELEPQGAVRPHLGERGRVTAERGGQLGVGDAQCLLPQLGELL